MSSSHSQNICLYQLIKKKKKRSALGISKSIDILQHIRDLPPEEALVAADKIKAIERTAMRAQQPQPGLVELMDYLQHRGVRRALCTRNFECVFFFFSDPHA